MFESNLRFMFLYVFCVFLDGIFVKVISFLFKDLGELMFKRGEGMKK